MSLEIQNIYKTFEDDTSNPVLQNINLQIDDGEFICLVGPSGCGKSTLLNVIAGLEEATKGTIRHNGQVVTKPGADRVMMFQEHALFPWLSVKENVKFGMSLAGLSKPEQEEYAMHYLKMVELDAYADYPIHKISGGMKQRASLARALALDSDLLLMDEPFSALDKQTINVLREELVKIWEKTGKTIIFVTHSVEEAVFFADRVVVLSAITGGIKSIYPVSIDRPRHIENPEFVSLRKQILEDVRTEARRELYEK